MPKEETKKLKFTERELEIALILSELGAKKEEMGVIDMTIAFGIECWERGRKEMEKEMEKDYINLKDWAESKGLDVTTYGKNQ